MVDISAPASVMALGGPRSNVSIPFDNEDVWSDLPDLDQTSDLDLTRVPVSYHSETRKGTGEMAACGHVAPCVHCSASPPVQTWPSSTDVLNEVLAHCQILAASNEFVDTSAPVEDLFPDSKDEDELPPVSISGLGKSSAQDFQVDEDEAAQDFPVDEDEAAQDFQVDEANVARGGLVKKSTHAVSEDEDEDESAVAAFEDEIVPTPTTCDIEAALLETTRDFEAVQPETLPKPKAKTPKQMKVPAPTPKQMRNQRGVRTATQTLKLLLDRIETLPDYKSLPVAFFNLAEDRFDFFQVEELEFQKAPVLEACFLADIPCLTTPMSEAVAATTLTNLGNFGGQSKSLVTLQEAINLAAAYADRQIDLSNFQHLPNYTAAVTALNEILVAVRTLVFTQPQMKNGCPIAGCSFKSHTKNNLKRADHRALNQPALCKRSECKTLWPACPCERELLVKPTDQKIQSPASLEFIKSIVLRKLKSGRHHDATAPTQISKTNRGEGKIVQQNLLQELVLKLKLQRCQITKAVGSQVRYIDRNGAPKIAKLEPTAINQAICERHQARWAKFFDELCNDEPLASIPAPGSVKKSTKDLDAHASGRQQLYLSVHHEFCIKSVLMFQGARHMLEKKVAQAEAALEIAQREHSNLISDISNVAPNQRDTFQHKFVSCVLQVFDLQQEFEFYKGALEKIQAGHPMPKAEPTMDQVRVAHTMFERLLLVSTLSNKRYEFGLVDECRSLVLRAIKSLQPKSVDRRVVKTMTQLLFMFCVAYAKRTLSVIVCPGKNSRAEFNSEIFECSNESPFIPSSDTRLATSLRNQLTFSGSLMTLGNFCLLASQSYGLLDSSKDALTLFDELIRHNLDPTPYLLFNFSSRFGQGNDGLREYDNRFHEHIRHVVAWMLGQPVQGKISYKDFKARVLDDRSRLPKNGLLMQAARDYFEDVTTFTDFQSVIVNHKCDTKFTRWLNLNRGHQLKVLGLTEATYDRTFASDEDFPKMKEPKKFVVPPVAINEDNDSQVARVVFGPVAKKRSMAARAPPAKKSRASKETLKPPTSREFVESSDEESSDDES